MNRLQAAENALHDQTNILPFKQLMVVYSGLAISLLLATIDQNGISVTLPTIAKDLQAEDTISWAGTSALIANTVFSVLYGRLSDIFGRKIVYLSALGLLCLADLACGLAKNAPMFYIFRGLAGLAGGGVTSMTMIIVSDLVTLQDRGKYQGVLGGCIGIGNVLGPFIAAAFIERATWRGFFWLLSPLAALAIITGYLLIPNNHVQKDGLKASLARIDYFGILASSLGMVFLLIPISGGGAYFAWDSTMVIAMLVLGCVSMVVFVVVEWRVASLPVLPLVFFRSKIICALFLQTFLLGMVYQSYLFYLPLYYQNAREWSPIVSAGLIAPMVGCQSISSITSGQYISRMKRYREVIWLGFGLWTLGAGLTLLFSDQTSKATIGIIMAIIGLGVGLTFQPALIALQANTTKAQRAVVISDRNYFRCLGAACGLAVSAALLQASLRANLPAGYEYLAHSTYAVPRRDDVGVADWEGISRAYLKASRAVFVLQVPLIGVALGACVFFREGGFEDRHVIEKMTRKINRPPGRRYSRENRPSRQCSTEPQSRPKLYFRISQQAPLAPASFSAQPPGMPSP
ncbi:hypothetical protein BDW74DRAFT_167572 [Aspergillus multicolor]|uniref:uncharacterized protein n=1 Tax=Aspergillus multicolor TaxID=41759 RepID=UPI003CCDCA06